MKLRRTAGTSSQYLNESCEIALSSKQASSLNSNTITYWYRYKNGNLSARFQLRLKVSCSLLSACLHGNNKKEFTKMKAQAAGPAVISSYGISERETKSSEKDKMIGQTEEKMEQ
jgi:hypothetical protein